MAKMISIMPYISKNDKDLVTVVIADMMSGKNKVTFHCHIKSLEDIITNNLFDYER